ncbi:hypothetical protein BC830DRAFT_823317 [Chytriomyces sp. MP71]|nr:hypothetical protein BC830DRAFT_823317 [Chytriomyces sp. MP71]
MMTLNLALVKSIKACGVVATVTPKSQRRVAIDEDKLDLTNENSIEISRSFSKSPVRRRTLTATSNVDDASSCHMVNEFEIEMKDGEIISFSTLGEAFEEDDPLSPNNSHSVSPQRHEPWWKLGSISANDDMIPCESMDSAASVLHENFLDGDFDEVFEEIHITSPSRSEQQYNFEQSREELRDGTASVTRRWLREICRAASTIGDETLPDWLTHY